MVFQQYNRTTPFDVLIVKDNSIVGVVEVKNRNVLSLDHAKQIHRSMLLHAAFPAGVQYFLLLSQDCGYLWHDPLAADQPFFFSMQGVVQRYYSGKDQDIRLRSNEFEILVMQWLSDLQGIIDDTQDPEKSLLEHGFIDSISNATILSGA